MATDCYGNESQCFSCPSLSGHCLSVHSKKSTDKLKKKKKNDRLKIQSEIDFRFIDTLPFDQLFSSDGIGHHSNLCHFVCIHICIRLDLRWFANVLN